MNEEKMKKTHDIAHEITSELFGSCDPEEMGIIISVVMESIHKQFRSDIEEAKERFANTSDSYSTFLSNITFEETKELKHFNE